MLKANLNIIMPTTNPFSAMKIAEKFVCDDVNFLIVANGRFDKLPESKFDKVIILHLERPLSPYAGRNYAMRHVESGHIAFLDDSCQPDVDWINRAKFNLLSGCELVAGEVRFAFANPGKPTYSELLDSMTNIQQQSSVAKGYAKTTNLFVSEKVWRKVGNFDSSVRSGEDVVWTKKAVSLGYKLTFDKHLIVYKDARTFLPLIKKSLRTGAGKGVKLKSLSRLRLGLSKGFIPLSPAIFLKIRSSDAAQTLSYVDCLCIYLLGCLMKVLHSIGILFPRFFSRVD